jgi:hypothetical protein
LQGQSRPVTLQIQIVVDVPMMHIVGEHKALPLLATALAGKKKGYKKGARIIF